MYDLDLFMTGPSLHAEMAPQSRKALHKLKKSLRSRRFSANLVVDIGGTCQITTVSITGLPLLSGAAVFAASGALIGQTVDLLNANTFCNLFAMGQSASGQLRLQVQTSDSDVSGTFTDPTSGIASLPLSFSSGGIVFINSGGAGGGLLGAQTSGQSLASGFAIAAAFTRQARFARVNTLLEGSVQYAGPLVAGFVSQFKTTGSGGGFSWSPQSGLLPINV